MCVSLVDVFAGLVQVLVECFTGSVKGHRQEHSLVGCCLSFCLVGCLSFYLSLTEGNLDLVDKCFSLNSLFSENAKT